MNPETLPLFTTDDPQPVPNMPRYRPTDPDTSKEAGSGPEWRWSDGRRRVARGLLLIGPSTDFALAEFIHMDKGSVSKRRGELEKMGFVIKSGWTCPSLTTGSKANVYELTHKGVEQTFGLK